jgi:hypothetical protein
VSPNELIAAGSGSIVLVRYDPSRSPPVMLGAWGPSRALREEMMVAPPAALLNHPIGCFGGRAG